MKKCDEIGSVVILKNNVPRYLLVEFKQAEREQEASDDDVLHTSKKLITKNRIVYEKLAKGEWNEVNLQK